MGNNYLEIRELYHHGIKGQKWGMRRFQNEDGTLTDAGKERYLKTEVVPYHTEDGQLHWKKQTTFDKKQYEKDVEDTHGSIMDIFGAAKSISNETANLAAPKKGSKVVNKKDCSKMSDEELRKKVNRLQMERQYGDLTGDNKYVMTGREKAKEVLQTVGALLGIAVSAVTVAGLIHNIRQSKLSGRPKPAKK